MRFNFLSSIALIASCSIVRAAEYPKIDPSAHWINVNLAGGNIYGLSKSVLTSASTSEIKTVFHRVAFQGIKVDNTFYPMSDYSQVISESCSDDVLNLVCQGIYGFVPLPDSPDPSENPNFQYKVSFSSSFTKDGFFQLIIDLEKPYSLNVPFAAAIMLDYDFNGASDDIFEFTWPDQPYSAPHPPLNSSPLTYLQPYWNTWSNYWGAVPNEVTVKYAQSFVELESPTNLTPGRKPLFRALDAGTSLTQFGAVFWPNGINTNSRHDYSITTKAYGGLPIAPWVPNTATSIQTTAVWNGYNRYAHGGSDQMVQILFTKATMPYMQMFEIFGKLFQRPNARPLKMFVKYHSEVGAWVNSPVGNVFDQTIRTVSGENRNMRTAMRRLVPDENIFLEASTMPMFSPYGNGSTVDISTLHNMIANCLACKETPTHVMTIPPFQTLKGFDYEVNSWIVHAYITNWWSTLGTDVKGIMFDGTATSTRTDGQAREASAIFWPAILASKNNQLSPAQKLTSLVTLHEVGHALNFNHEWSSCKAHYDGCSSTNPATIMSSYPHDHSTVGHLIRFNEAPVDAFGYDRHIPNFYKYAPESWVKPGRNGYRFTEKFSIPNYTTY